MLPSAAGRKKIGGEHVLNYSAQLFMMSTSSYQITPGRFRFVCQGGCVWSVSGKLYTEGVGQELIEGRHEVVAGREKRDALDR